MPKVGTLAINGVFILRTRPDSVAFGVIKGKNEILLQISTAPAMDYHQGARMVGRIDSTPDVLVA